MNKETNRIVGKGEYYTAKDPKKDKELVAVYYADMREVGYAPVGSSKEFRTNHQEFLENFDFVELEKAIKLQSAS